ncbi:alanine racemase [Roseicyclus sp. F158]|uniref:Alanine racemase n=1 Tax=Tropicimonas omnivorans TaxID=3075590 RepID=A0ABU3DIE2_9RHOB|nr:alanine racemase [Roseicyclus sp. F158]MDT0683486.1 alanine racemase [Roseicyclus sp. F158]
MAGGILSIDLDAIAANWRALDAMSGRGTTTAAVVKADGYGLGASRVAKVLRSAGVESFFVAMPEEGVALRLALGGGPEIFVFNGHMQGDTSMIRDHELIPLLNSIEQMTFHFEHLPDAPFGVQLDSGMNRLGLEPGEWEAVAPFALPRGPKLLMSHLASADEPGSPQNEEQLAAFRDMTDGTGIRRSLSATGGTLLGPDYHFEMTRPGVGLYGGLPFADAIPAAHLRLPVIQTRLVAPGEAVGYNATWAAREESLIATVAGGYADGLLRSLSGRGALFQGEVPCPIRGRVSMDLIGVDISHLDEIPDHLDMLSPAQTVNDVADAAGTIPYEILTSLGTRYRRSYHQ